MPAHASACIKVKSFAFNAYVVSIKSQTSVYQIQGSAKDKQNAINVHPKIFNFLRKFSKSSKIDFFERWFDESYELDLPEIINQIIKYSTNDSFPNPKFISFQFYFSFCLTNKILLIGRVGTKKWPTWIFVKFYHFFKCKLSQWVILWCSFTCHSNSLLVLFKDSYMIH